MKHYLYILILFLCFSTNQANGQQTPILTAEQKRELSNDNEKLETYRSDFITNPPKPIYFINDLADIFTEEQEKELQTIIYAFEEESSMEICIVTLDTFCVAYDDISDFTLKLANKWMFGKLGKNNGIVIAVFKGYEYLRIQNGKGTETIISDYTTKRIIETAFLPSYKNGDYYTGTLTGLNELIAYLRPRASWIK